MNEKSIKYLGIFLLQIAMVFGFYDVSSAFVLANQDTKNHAIKGFNPVLLHVEISSDMLNPNEDLLVTLTWQNIGDRPSESPLKGYMELRFGHQRIEEIRLKSHRFYYQLYPSTMIWNPGEIWKTTFKWTPSGYWGGTYKIEVGLCNEENNPIEHHGLKGEKTLNSYVGDVDLGWGYGQPVINKTRKEWTKTFNEPLTGIISHSLNNEKSVEIGNVVKVRLLKEAPTIISIRDDKAGFSFLAVLPVITLRDKKNNNLLYSSNKKVITSYKNIGTGKDSVSYTCSISYNDNEIASFHLNFKINQRQIEITLDHDKDYNDFELIEIYIPSLLTAEGYDIKLIDIFKGGRLIPINNTKPMGFKHLYDVRGIAGIYNSERVITMETTCLDDMIHISVQETIDKKTGVIGVSLISRVHAKVDSISSVKVFSNHRILINLLDDYWGSPSWQAAARFWQTGLESKNRDIYRRSLVYKMLATVGPPPEPDQLTGNVPNNIKRLTTVKTYDQILNNVKQLHNLFDGVQQIVYIGGFQKGGFDTGYPYTLETDLRTGTVDDLRRCIQEGKKYNAIIAMHDNFDDAYKSEYFKPGIIALDAYGRLWKGWIWAGGQSYIISPYKYKKSGLMQERVKKTVETYGIHTSYHLDVLSSEILRYDFDPSCPASAELSLVGKYSIIEEFNKYDIDLTSETLVHPMVGHIGYAWSTRNDRRSVLFTGEKYIPLESMIYHGTIGYSCRFNSDDDSEFMWAILTGSNFSTDNLTEKYVKQFYLLNLPGSLLYDKKIKNFIENGPVKVAIYDDKTYVKCNFDLNTYEVIVDGQLVAKNWTSFAPGFKDDCYLAFSVNGGEMSYPVPKGWKTGIKPNAVTITTDGDGIEIPCTISKDNLFINMPAEVPVKVLITSR